ILPLNLFHVLDQNAPKLGTTFYKHVIAFIPILLFCDEDYISLVRLPEKLGSISNFINRDVHYTLYEQFTLYRVQDVNQNNCFHRKIDTHFFFFKFYL
ncbi:MAG: hypothetical protein ACI8RD_014120, partial [Bacillariaceae sp.]